MSNTEHNWMVSIRIGGLPDGGLHVWSDDEPGLILSGTNPAKVMACVLPALAALRDHREGRLPPDDPGLSPQVRTFNETFSAWTVIKERFLPHLLTEDEKRIIASRDAR